jgi:hypothetical protein
MKSENSYKWLSNDERLSLFLQASSRRDTLEARAVIEASPRVEVKIVDFSADVHALMFAMLLHCLSQANLFIAIRDLWENRDNDESYLCARLFASTFAVREEAWRSISQEYGFDYDKLLVSLADSMYLYSAPFFDWVKTLVFTKTEYKISRMSMSLKLQTLEEAKKEHRETIDLFRKQFR